MTRYIDADEIIKYLKVYGDEEWTSSELEGLLNNALTIDAVEVVRCGNCKYLGIKDFVYGYCKKKVIGEVKPNDFCSYGERKSNVSEEEKEYLNKAFPEHKGGEWFDITDLMTKGEIK